jgi:putative protein-disulfide isomerase
MSKTPSTLYYVHDPMCSWCWAYRPVLTKLRENLPAGILWQNVLGGLAPDNDQPMPEQTRNMVIGHWRDIQAKVGSEFNFDFWTRCKPRRDTYKACRAVIAASRQNAEEAMIEAIQKAYYLRAMNPSEPETLAELAVELGLDQALFVNDLGSAKTDTEFRRQLLLRAELYVRSFPSLVLEHGAGRALIRHDYEDFRASLVQIQICLEPGITRQ